jgi:hypothetical protein
LSLIVAGIDVDDAEETGRNRRPKRDRKKGDCEQPAAEIEVSMAALAAGILGAKAPGAGRWRGGFLGWRREKN